MPSRSAIRVKFFSKLMIPSAKDIASCPRPAMDSRPGTFADAHASTVFTGVVEMRDPSLIALSKV